MSLYDNIRKPWAAWEMTMEAHDPVNHRTLDMSGNGRHLQLGDGAGGSEPTKLTQTRGYRNPSGGSNYLRGVGIQGWASATLSIELMLGFIREPTADCAIIDSFDVADVLYPFSLWYSNTNSRYEFWAGGAAAAQRMDIPGSACRGVFHIVASCNGATRAQLSVDGLVLDTATTPLTPNVPTADVDWRLFQQDDGTDAAEGLDIYFCRVYDAAVTRTEARELARRARRELTLI